MSVKTPTKVDPFDTPKERTSAGVFGMWIFIVVVGMLFAACILGYLVVRLDSLQGKPWLPPGAPGLPHALLLSTALLLAGSWTIQHAVRAMRLNHAVAAHAAIGWTLVLACIFIVVQCVAWAQLWQQQAGIDSSLYAWTFYVLTGVHALHVLGGLPPLVLVFKRSAGRAYSSGNYDGLLYCAMYWHALDVIWIALYATLWLGS